MKVPVSVQCDECYKGIWEASSGTGHIFRYELIMYIDSAVINYNSLDFCSPQCIINWLNKRLKEQQ